MTAEEINRAVDTLAAEMKRVLLLPENLDKRPNWHGMRSEDLFLHLVAQQAKLGPAIDEGQIDDIKRRAVNMANYAMMIYDRVRRQELEKRQ